MHGKITCGLCHYHFDYGVHVCQGCLGAVVYGATPQEIRQGRDFGGALWGSAAIIVIMVIPGFLDLVFGLNIPLGWGLGIWPLMAVPVAIVIGSVQGSNKAQESKRGWVRTFR